MAKRATRKSVKKSNPRPAAPVDKRPGRKATDGSAARARPNPPERPPRGESSAPRPAANPTRAEANRRRANKPARELAATAKPGLPQVPATGTGSNLTPADVEEFRQMLLDKRAQLRGDVGALQDGAMRGSRREASGDLSSMPVHMADLGSDNYELEFTLGLIEGERALLQEIDEALERIRTGQYGICLATGKPIGKARLKAKPWAKFCYEHMLALEKGRQVRF